MSATTFTAPHERIGYPDDVHAGSMTIGQERAALTAYGTLLERGARVAVAHRLPNGLGYVAPNTGHVHGPAIPSSAEVLEVPGYLGPFTTPAGDTIRTLSPRSRLAAGTPVHPTLEVRYRTGLTGTAAQVQFTRTAGGGALRRYPEHGTSWEPLEALEHDGSESDAVRAAVRFLLESYHAGATSRTACELREALERLDVS